MKTEYKKTDIPTIPDAKIAIIQAKWHSDYTDNMVAACTELLLSAQANPPTLIKVPGAYEIPLIAKLVASSKKYEAIVVFGAIVKGATDHYKVILDTCITELGKVMYDYEVPLIMELLPVHKIEDLIERSQGTNNKGIEAAQAACEIITVCRNFKESKK